MKKLIAAASLESLLDLLKSNNQKIVFTNGCFDILHPGHIDYLQKAKALGDVLFIGLNSDHSIKLLKGDSRPINAEEDRIIMLAALESVDFIVTFEEETPIKIIHKIKPDILVKGGDYIKENIIGSKEVIEYGGEVKIIDFLEGYSTTQLIAKINLLK